MAMLPTSSDVGALSARTTWNEMAVAWQPSHDDVATAALPATTAACDVWWKTSAPRPRSAPSRTSWTTWLSLKDAFPPADASAGTGWTATNPATNAATVPARTAVRDLMTAPLSLCDHWFR